MLLRRNVITQAPKWIEICCDLRYFALQKYMFLRNSVVSISVYRVIRDLIGNGSISIKYTNSSTYYLFESIDAV